MISSIRYAVFSGGGINGAVSFGAWLFIERLFAIAGTSMHDRMLGAAGTSMGALLALCVVIGVRPAESIFSTLSILANSMKQKEVSLKKAFLLSGGCDLDDVRKFLVDLMISKGISENVTFGGLKECVGRELVVIVNEVRTASLVVLNSSDHPNAHVVDAIIASMSIPIIFQPVKIRGISASLYFSDGGLLLNFPWEIFPANQSIGFWLTEVPTPFKTVHECSQVGSVEVPGLHIVALSLIRNVTRQINVHDQKKFLHGDPVLRQHIIPLYTEIGGLDFVQVDHMLIRNYVHKGILLTLLHYLSIKPERASCGTKWQDCFAALASIYHSDSIVTDL